MKRVSTIIVKKRMIIVFLFGLFIFLIMGIRLGYVQFFEGEKLVRLATDSWSRDIQFEAERGNILDRDGEILVKNVSAPSLVVVPRQIKEPKKTAQLLADILDMSEEKAYENVTKQTSMQNFHPEGRKLKDEQVEKIRELDLDGVYLRKDSKRFYPNEKDLSHVLGFTGIDNQGLMGLELFYDDMLKGEKGSLSYFADAKGSKINRLADRYSAPTDGFHLKTTIDAKVQTILEREMDLAVEQYNPDGALAIAVNPKTGGILGMTTRPNFSPSHYKQVDANIFDRNLPIWSTFEPGSTFKIITLAAALEEGIVDLEKDTYDDTGSIKVGGAKLKCWKSGGHGKQTYAEVVQNSCNPGFVTLGQDLGKEKLFSYIRGFGFGKKTGIDLAGEGSGILFQEENVGPVELATTSFGQGVSVTPIQQVMAVSAAVNGGYLYEPHIAKSWQHPKSDKTVKKVGKHMKNHVISNDASKEVRETLESVVAKGTGRPAFVEGYRVGGKTGTAQKVGEDGQYMTDNYVVSFVGFAPSDDPEIVVYVAVDHPKDTVQFGGVVAAPIVGTIIEDSLQAMDVPRRKKGLEKKVQWPEEPKVTVPELIGLKTDDLVEDMTDLTIEVNGKGKYIIDQSPEAGTKVKAGSKIRIYLSPHRDRDSS